MLLYFILTINAFQFLVSCVISLILAYYFTIEGKKIIKNSRIFSEFKTIDKHIKGLRRYFAKEKGIKEEIYYILYEKANYAKNTNYNISKYLMENCLHNVDYSIKEKDSYISEIDFWKGILINHKENLITTLTNKGLDLDDIKYFINLNDGLFHDYFNKSLNRELVNYLIGEGKKHTYDNKNYGVRFFSVLYHHRKFSPEKVNETEFLRVIDIVLGVERTYSLKEIKGIFSNPVNPKGYTLDASLKAFKKIYLSFFSADMRFEMRYVREELKKAGVPDIDIKNLDL